MNWFKKQFIEGRKSMPIRSACDKCKHIEHYSLVGFVVEVMVRLVAILGLFFIFILATMPSLPGTLIMQYNSLSFAEKYSVELREAALNLTTYDGDQPFVAADELMQNIGHIRYTLPSVFNQLQPPLETLKSGGDCKNTAVLFSGMMMNLGYDSFVWCSQAHRHCVSRLNWGNRYMVADLAADEIIVFSGDDNYWAWFETRNESVPIMHKEYSRTRPRTYVKDCGGI